MKYYVLRINDKLSSDECIQKEKEINSAGGIELDLNSPLLKKGSSPDYRTGLFHPNCRCHLYPSITGQPIHDVYDWNMYVGGGFLSSYSDDKFAEVMKYHHNSRDINKVKEFHNHAHAFSTGK